MMPSLRFREYVEAANLAHQRAQNERNPHAKQMFAGNRTVPLTFGRNRKVDGEPATI